MQTPYRRNPKNEADAFFDVQQIHTYLPTDECSLSYGYGEGQVRQWAWDLCTSTGRQQPRSSVAEGSGDERVIMNYALQ